MILLINTADQGSIVVALAKGGNIVSFEDIATPHHGAGKILSAIERLLKKQKASLQGIVVVSGPGAFTAVRLGVVIANTIAWSLHIPIVGVKRTTFATLADLGVKSGGLIKRARKGKLVVPYYGKEPNITISRHA